jgi:hypothetical protein
VPLFPSLLKEKAQVKITHSVVGQDIVISMYIQYFERSRDCRRRMETSMRAAGDAPGMSPDFGEEECLDPGPVSE